MSILFLYQNNLYNCGLLSILFQSSLLYLVLDFLCIVGYLSCIHHMISMSVLEARFKFQFYAF